MDLVKDDPCNIDDIYEVEVYTPSIYDVEVWIPNLASRQPEFGNICMVATKSNTVSIPTIAAIVLALARSMESRKRPLLDAEDSIVTKKRVLTGANGSPQVNGSSENDDNEDFREKLEVTSSLHIV